MSEIQESAPFYEGLKKLRTERDIELTEVSNRTKIGMDYLEAIEAGDFSFLPYVYVRLFVKAYAVEIGADVRDALEQLDHFMDQETPADDLPISEDGEQDEALSAAASEKSLLPESMQNKTASLVKLSVLLIVVFFGIYVVRQISGDEDQTTADSEAVPLAVTPKITDQELNGNYIATDVEQELDMEAPYTLTMSATEETWYEFETDYSGDISSANLTGGDDFTLDFSEHLYLRLERAADVSVSINGIAVPLQDVPHPSDVTYDSQMKLLTVRSYRPR